MKEVTKLQGRPFFVVIRCTLPCRNPTSPSAEPASTEPSAFGDDLVDERISLCVERECLQNAMAEQRKVPLQSAYPNSSLRIRREGTARRNLRRRELFTHLEIADTHKLSRITGALCPNIAVNVLCHSNHQPKRLVIRFGQAAEPPILEQIESVIHSHPQVSGAVFQHGGDLITRKTIPGANGGDGPVLLDVIERAKVCDPDCAISAGQNAVAVVLPQSLQASRSW